MQGRGGFSGTQETPGEKEHCVPVAIQGASLRTIMERLGHTDVKSSLRYQAGDIEVVRIASNRLPKLS